MHVVQLGTISTVEAAVARAASSTGVDFSFLLNTARRESGLFPGAHAPTSSAAGLFQFVEQTWMATLKRHGAAYGYARYADLISEGPDGRFFVPQGEEARRTVMDLRYDPHAASVMAGELVSDHAAYLRGRVGREPTGGELYAAHFLGAEGSARLIEAYQSNPSQSAAALFPEAAVANRNVFYRDGRPVTVSELYVNLGRNAGGGGSVERAIERDPGEGAFTAYAGAAHLEREREEAMLVNFILTSDPGQKAPAASLFSTEMLTELSKANATRSPG